ncbi:MAG TPA: SAM-dependent methyltransferase [Gemmatimonadales bacterium]
MTSLRSASRTAWMVALRRAAHQLMDRPPVFTDPLGLRILGRETAAELERDPRYLAHRVSDRYLRAFLAARSRIAEDTLAELVGQGLRQYVILGAGLDTFAYRNPWPELRVWEVDHPATQGWKRERLAKGEITVPFPEPFVPVDFAHQDLEQALVAAGLDLGQPTFFSWLGVAPYLERPAIDSLLGFVARASASGGGIVFDYFIPPHTQPLVVRLMLALRRWRLRKIGEPWRTYFDPAQLSSQLHNLGFRDVTDFTPALINERYFAGREDGLKVGSVGRVMRAVNAL